MGVHTAEQLEQARAAIAELPAALRQVIVLRDVEGRTDYLDGEANEDDRRRIQTHLEHCRGCQTALEQFQAVIGLAGRLSAVDVAGVDPLIHDRLTAALRRPRRR